MATNQGHSLGNGCVGSTNDWLCGHQTTRGELIELHEHTDVFGLFFIHQLKKRLGAFLGQIGH